MRDEQQPTICKECKHFPGGEWADAICPIEPFLNYVNGEVLYRHCHQKNTGNCRGYEPADIDALNHALCAVCGLSPCACGTGHMGEVE